MRSRALIRPLMLAAALGSNALALAAGDARHVVLISIDGFPAALWQRDDLPAPNLRRLAAAGASARAMTVSNPSLTWPNHTTLVTGVSPRRHGVLFNGLVVSRERGVPPRTDPGADKTTLVQAPTVYDLAHGAGLTTAESNWVAVLRAPTITWSFPEIPKHDTPLVREMIAAGALTSAQVEDMQWGKPTNLPWHDEMWLNAAQYIVQRHRPNLLLYHILTTDSVHHNFGPGNVASFAAIGFADRLVGELIRTFENAGLIERTTFIVATDHGFKKVTHIAYPNVVLKKAGLLQVAGPRLVKGEAYVKAGGGFGLAYVTDPARRDELKPRLRDLLAASEGIGQIIDGDEGPSLGLPATGEHPGMGDLILYPKPGYAFNESAAGDAEAAPSRNYAGTHGYQASDPELDGIFIISGRGVKSGVTLDRVNNVDVAPTIAHLLGLAMRDVEGRVLAETLTSAPTQEAR